MEKVAPILGRLASAIQRGDRRGRRQTEHAKQRKTIQRPIDKAMADLRKANPERMFRDLKTKAIAVWGNKGRCHIFNDNGKHVTSFTIHGEAVALRLRKKRWAQLETAQARDFLGRATDPPQPS